MKKIFKLYVMLQKNSRSDKDAGTNVDTNMVLSMMILVTVSAALGFFAYKNAEIVESLSGPRMIIPMAGVLITVAIIGLGGFRLISSMYMSSDIEVLITMPFSGMQIAILRVFAFFQLALLGSLGITLAPCIGLSMVCPLSVNEWIVAVVTAILLPVFVISILASVIILLMSILKIFQSRELLRLIGTIFLFVLMCAYLFFNNGGKMDILAMLTKASQSMESMKYVIPLIGFAMDCLEKSSLLYLVFEVLCSVVAFAVFFVMAKHMYLRGAMSMQDASKGKMLTEEDLDRYCKQKPLKKALVNKEFLMVRRNSVYMLYNFIVGALWPVVVVIAFKSILPAISDMFTDLSSSAGGFGLSQFVLYSTIFSYVMLFIISIPLSMQTIAYSSISREGKSFPIMKQIPAAYEEQLEAKRSMAARIAQISITGYSILIAIVIAILLKLSILYFIIPLILVALMTEVHVDFDMFLGILNANVNWDDERIITKKPNFIAIIDVLAVMFIPVGVGGLLAFGALKNILNLPVCFGITMLYGIVELVLIVVLRRRIAIDGEKKIRKLRF